ncbi:FAD-dependent monooxygenase [Streptomyces violascens]|uniref:FAD-dependent monooxygenase n=1 Tax=Streptomyces violascens TaxID=67381 RepID=UPI003652A9E6
MTRSTASRIAIIGAGPGGLICARILQQHGITATVHDHDASRAAQFSGMGANLAMLDGADLARALVDHPAIADAVRAYEDLLFPRSKEAAASAAEGIEGAFAPDSAAQTLAHMTQHH